MGARVAAGAAAARPGGSRIMLSWIQMLSSSRRRSRQALLLYS